MTNQEKVAMLRTFISDNEANDAMLTSYLVMAGEEIVNRMYYLKGMPSVKVVPSEYEIVQVNAVVSAFTLRGAENESVHDEEGIKRTFAYPDMIAYIKAHVTPYVGVGA